MLDTPKIPARIVLSKHRLLCSLVIWFWVVVLSALPGVQFHLLHLIFFLYLSTHQLHELLSSTEKKECIIKQETVRKAVIPLWLLVLIAAFTMSLKPIRDWAPWGQKGKETKLKTVWRTVSLGVHICLKWTQRVKGTPWYMSFFTVYFLTQELFFPREYGIISVFLFHRLQHARECANVKRRFILGEIPGELERAGFIPAGHVNLVPGSIAKHCTLWHISPPSLMDQLQSETPAENSWWTEGERESGAHITAWEYSALPRKSATKARMTHFEQMTGTWVLANWDPLGG